MRAQIVVALLVTATSPLIGGEDPAPPTPSELVEQLVRNPGGPAGNEGFGDPFSSFPGREPTPAKRLLDLRLEAVPALIEALGDDRHTRVVGGRHAGKHPGYSYSVLHVGEVAEMILERIAGRRFRPMPKSGEPYHVDPFDFGKGARPMALAWWRAVLSKGEAALLAEEVRAADMYVVQRAERLASLYPDRALAPLAEARKKIGPQTANMQRKILVRLIADLPGDGPVSVLREEMKDAPHLVQRVTAAFGLRRRGVPETYDAMLAEWKRLDDYGVKNLCALNPMPINRAIHQLVVFLVTSGRPEGIRALGAGLEQRPPRVRALVVRALGRGEVTFNLYGYSAPWESRDPKAPLDPAATEVVLRARLGDKDPDPKHFGERKGKDWRICDLAARALAERFPERYAFDITRPVDERDARIAVIRGPADTPK